MRNAFSTQHKNLIRRYLLWAYFSTRENFERIERKTTQLIVDEYIFDYFTQHKLTIPQEFRAYITDKRKEELKLKFADTAKDKLHPQYTYLKNRLEAIEGAVKHFLGGMELKRFAAIYEKEFTRRIIETKDH